MSFENQSPIESLEDRKRKVLDEIAKMDDRTLQAVRSRASRGNLEGGTVTGDLRRDLMDYFAEKMQTEKDVELYTLIVEVSKEHGALDLADDVRET